MSGPLKDGGTQADDAALAVLGRRAEIVDEPGVAGVLDGLATRGQKPRASDLLVNIARGRSEVRTYKKGRVFLGRIVVTDGGPDPRLVIAQTPILAGGYFAGAAAGTDRPIGFRAEGYAPVDASLGGEDEPVTFLGEVAMKPVPPAEQAGIRGRVTVDDPAGLSKVAAVVRADMAPTNSPSGGYIPSLKSQTRARPVAISPDGSFRIGGLSPGDHRLIVNAEGRVTAAFSVKLVPGRRLPHARRLVAELQRPTPSLAR